METTSASTSTSTSLQADAAAEQPQRKDSGQLKQPLPEDQGWLEGSPGKLATGLFVGFVFGFLLQKGGVAKFDILVGALLLENFVVVKVMLSAIIVGMVGSWFLRRMGVIDLKIKETRYGANTIGGLIFGVGFGLLAYCPGTNAAAIGQGNFDALVGLIGLVIGSYAYALSTKLGSGALSSLGERGKLTLPEVAGVSPGVFILVAAPALAGLLVILEVVGY